MLADEFEELIKPQGIALVIKAHHACMSLRGVREDSDCSMTNSIMRGVFREDKALKAEFMELIKAQGFN